MGGTGREEVEGKVRGRRGDGKGGEILNLQPRNPAYAPAHCISSVSRTAVGKRALAVSGDKLWNELPSDISSASSLSVFSDSVFRLICSVSRT